MLACRRHYARCLAEAGHRITPDHLSLGISAYVADSKAEAVREMGPYHLYFNRTLLQISLNRGVLPHEIFMEQIRRFAAEVLPALQAHRIEHVPLVEEVAASRCVVIVIPAKAEIQDVRPRRLPWPTAFAGATDS